MAIGQSFCCPLQKSWPSILFHEDAKSGHHGDWGPRYPTSKLMNHSCSHTLQTDLIKLAKLVLIWYEWMLLVQEIPTSFLRAQFHMFEEINGEYEVTLTTAGTRDTNEEWPVFLTEHPMPKGSLVPSHVYAFGKSGWADFATDNDIQVGDLVVFQLVDISCFQVFVMPKV